MEESGTRTALLAVILVAAASPVIFGAEAEEGGSAPSPPAVLRRQDYEGFYPFYSRTRYEDGGVKTNAAFHLLQSESGSNGDRYYHLLPFYYSSWLESSSDRQLGLLPFYLRRRSPEAVHDIVAPSFARWRSGTASHVVLWPLLQTAGEPQPGPFRYIPTLYRHGAWTEEQTDRLGVPVLIELFERSSKPDQTAYTLGNFFNFSKETESGLPLGKFRFKPTGDYRGHLFPLIFAGRDGEESYAVTPLLAHWSGTSSSGWAAPLLLSWWKGRPEGKGSDLDLLWPLVRFERSPTDSTAWVAPFYFSGESRDAEAPISGYRFFSLLYGQVKDLKNDRTAHYVPPLLGHYLSAGDERRLDVLWPLGHYHRKGELESAVRALPLFDRYRDPVRASLGVGGILYRRHEDVIGETVGQWAPLPLVHWKTSPQGLIAWAIPAFYHAHRMVEDERVTTTAVAPGLVLHRRLKDLPEGGTLETLRNEFLWPLFSYHRRRDELGRDDRSYSTLFPFFRYSVRKNWLPEDARRELDAPWPFVHHESSGDTTRFRMFPLVFAGKETGRRYGYLWPVAGVETGPQGDRGFGYYTSFAKWYGTEMESEFRLDPFLFSWRKDGETTAVTGPFAWFRYRSSPESGWFHLLPIGFGQREGDRSGLGIFPFYYGREYGKEDINYWTAGRFFFLWNSLGNERERHRSLLWKAVQYTRGADGDSDFRILHRLVVNRSVKGQREVAVGPFFRWFTDRETGARSFSLLSILYRSDLRDGTETKRIFLIPVSVRKVGA